MTAAEKAAYEAGRKDARPLMVATVKGMVTLHERIASALGWSVEDVRSFSLHYLREIVRGRPGGKKVAAEITAEIASGRVVRQKSTGDM